MTGDYKSRYEAACRDQGFDLAIDNSPIETPNGWYNGHVHQTGGWIMVRIWRTTEDHLGVYTGNTVEYECAYGSDPGVSLYRHEWSNDLEGYEWAGEITFQTVDENTDERKAAVAKKLMEQFDRNRNYPNND